MSRKEWRPFAWNRDVELAAEAVLVFGTAVAKLVVGADTSREDQRLNDIVDEGRLRRGDES
jgi:hypothetical protein